MDPLLRDDVAAALARIRGFVSRDLRSLLDRDVEPDRLHPLAAYHFGFIDGVARSVDLTVLELLDALDLDVDGA
jgi:hypothetical protein